MARFEPAYPLEGLEGAEYNPRRIDESTLADLRKSLERLGVVKPIIVSGKLLVAGHQRTRSMRALGWTHAPAIVLGDISVADEIRVNQLHNGTDFDSGDENCTVPASKTLGYQYVSPTACRAICGRGWRMSGRRFVR
jgi:ParB family chromosome partitioning protein